MPPPSEPWITLQATDLNDYLAGDYADALRTAALADGQADPFLTIMTDVVNEIRSAIRGNPSNQVSLTPLSLPADLKRTAMALIVERMQARLAGAGVTLGVEAIEKAANIARRTIERIQEGKVVITAPPDPQVPDDQQRGSPIAVVRHTCRTYTREGMKGL